MNELLTWDTEDLDGPIVCEDLSSLRNFATRGTNLVMHGAAGARPYVPILDQLDVTLVWAVTGRLTPAGAPHASQQVGVELNLEHYRTLFTTGGDAVTGEHDIVYAFADTTFAGLAQLREYGQVRTGPGTARILTRLSIADGELAETGS